MCAPDFDGKTDNNFTKNIYIFSGLGADEKNIEIAALNEA